jgi:hypothetical protein
MRTNRLTNWFAVIVLSACWHALADHGAIADDKVGAKGKIKKLKQQRLAAANQARAFLSDEMKAGYVPPAVNSLAFYLQVVEVDRLAFQARLDLCETKRQRIKAIKEAIEGFEPIVARIRQQSKSGVGTGKLAFHLVQVHLLELKIALEKAKQGRRR